jgi:paspaline synthase
MSPFSCGNITWKFLFGLVYPSSAITLVAISPWFFLDVGLIYTTLKFGPSQFKNSPMIAKNIGLIILALMTWMTALQIAVIETVGVKEASFFTAFSLQSIVDCAAVAQLISRNNTSGHSLTIWY